MFKIISKVVLFTLILVNLTLAQSGSISEFLNGGKKTGPKSFASIDNFLEKNNKEFDNSNEVVNLFNQERGRLGDNFETELWKYLGNDLAKHYWISIFLESKEYLQGYNPMPLVAYKIMEKGVEIAVKEEDYPGLGMKFFMLRDMAVYLYLGGKRNEAISQKRKAQVIYKEIENLGVVGATTDYVMCIYENLERNTGGCKEETLESGQNADEDEDFDEKYTELSNSGVVNGKAILLPVPVYPKAARAVGASGEVKVEIVIDETGEVIQAKSLSGHKLLFDAATDAAMEAKFKPFMVKGKPVKVKGTIVYNFSK